MFDLLLPPRTRHGPTMARMNFDPIPFDIVGFDLDGTLIDTSGDLAAAVNHAIGTVGWPHSPSPRSSPSWARARGSCCNRRWMRRMCAMTRCWRQLLPVLLDYYSQNLAVHSLPYPGLIAAMGRTCDGGRQTGHLHQQGGALRHSADAADRPVGSVRRYRRRRHGRHRQAGPRANPRHDRARGRRGARSSSATPSTT